MSHRLPPCPATDLAAAPIEPGRRSLIASLLARSALACATQAGLRTTAATAASAAMLAAGPASAQATRNPWPRGRATPPLELPGVDRAPWNLASAKGQVVVLNFWASWCEPCRAEMPALELLAERHARQGLVIMAVNFKESEATIRRFTEQTSLTLPILRDADGDAARAWGVRIFPTTIVVGRDGRAVFNVLGVVDWGAESARRWIVDLL